MNCDFVLASKAETEMVWSVAKHALGDTRHRLTPETLEVLVLLKCNHSCAADTLILKAIRMGSAFEQHQEEQNDVLDGFLQFVVFCVLLACFAGYTQSLKRFIK